MDKLVLFAAPRLVG